MVRERGASRSRQRARELLIKALYQQQLTGHSVEELERQFAARPEFERCDRDYFTALLDAAVSDSAALDALIAGAAVRSLEQLDVVGRAILRLGLAELKFRPDVPTKVVINEAVELAKRYGAAESFRFVNAVLDKCAREMGERVSTAGKAQS